MAHNYTELTKSDNSYSEVSPVRDWEYQETLTWNALHEDYDTWTEFTDYGRLRWADWWQKVGLGKYTQLTTPTQSYQGVTV